MWSFVSCENVGRAEDVHIIADTLHFMRSRIDCENYLWASDLQKGRYASCERQVLVLYRISPMRMNKTRARFNGDKIFYFFFIHKNTYSYKNTLRFQKKNIYKLLRK